MNQLKEETKYERQFMTNSIMKYDICGFYSPCQTKYEYPISTACLPNNNILRKIRHLKSTTTSKGKGGGEIRNAVRREPKM
uniref:Ovule protein n=1 Tax=Heterorhabditis bacteriophora TaxID=37862 RepID=A0A1I7WVN7_HETBA